MIYERCDWARISSPADNQLVPTLRRHCLLDQGSCKAGNGHKVRTMKPRLDKMHPAKDEISTSQRFCLGHSRQAMSSLIAEIVASQADKTLRSCEMADIWVAQYKIDKIGRPKDNVKALWEISRLTRVTGARGSRGAALVVHCEKWEWDAVKKG